MNIASRQTMWSKPNTIQFLAWVQSDGNSIIPTNFSFPTGTEQVTLVASTTTSPNTHSPILYAGETGYTGYNSNATNGFMFLNKNSDRQTYVFYGNSRWWNSTANASNWNNGSMHQILMYRLSGSNPTIFLDRNIITLANEGSTSGQPSAVGSGTLCVFGPNQDIDVYVRSDVKVAQVKIESQNKDILADFRAALKYDIPGLYDIVSGKFYYAVNGALSYSDPIITGTKTFNVNGLSGNCIFMQVNGFNNITVFSWVKPSSSWTASNSASWYYAIVNGGIYFGKNGNTIEFYVGLPSSYDKIQYTYSVAANEWHHYCFVKSGSSYSFYVDGQLQETKTGSSSNTSGNGNFYLTQGNTGAQTNFDISYVSYGAFSRALTAEEVYKVYKAGANINPSVAPFNDRLILGLSLTEGSGNVVYDVASGQSITLSGTVNWNVDFNPTIA